MKVGQLVVRIAPNTGYAQAFMYQGHNYWLTKIETRGLSGNHKCQVAGSDGWFDLSAFRLATLEDAYNVTHGESPMVKSHAMCLVDDPVTVDEAIEMQTPKAQATPDDPTKGQVGGTHYKDMPTGYQPVDIAHALQLPALDFNVLRYLLRHRNKNGAQDIRKAIHMLEVILHKEYPGQ